MSIANPPPLGLEYNAVVEVVDKISAHTGLRTVDDFERLLCAMGGQIERVESQKWSAAARVSMINLPSSAISSPAVANVWIIARGRLMAKGLQSCPDQAFRRRNRACS